MTDQETTVQSQVQLADILNTANSLVSMLNRRSFPGLLRREAKGQRRFAPYARLQKGFLVNFFLLDRQRSKTPKGDEELRLILAGLGKRFLTVTESFTHSEGLAVLMVAGCYTSLQVEVGSENELSFLPILMNIVGSS
ncbi:hypothetical protein AMECASPLE_036819 [Ameca splendens]|uniref:Uncharacterized protein n=1 Tax=Ameca splendens TaxID=208324 RepID=A0ABV0XWR5_9TELE